MFSSLGIDEKIPSSLIRNIWEIILSRNSGPLLCPFSFTNRYAVLSWRLNWIDILLFIRMKSWLRRYQRESLIQFWSLPLRVRDEHTRHYEGSSSRGIEGEGEEQARGTSQWMSKRQIQREIWETHVSKHTKKTFNTHSLWSEKAAKTWLGTQKRNLEGEREGGSEEGGLGRALEKLLISEVIILIQQFFFTIKLHINMCLWWLPIASSHVLT